MQKIILTRKLLHKIDQDIKVWQATQPTIAFLLGDKIKRFYASTDVQMHIKIIDARFNDIKKKYVEQDTDGNFIIEDVDGQPKLKLLKVKVDITSAKTMNAEEIEKAFYTEGEKMFSQSVTIEW